jgi:hypothetical protein
MTSKGNVWIARRDEIARHWQQNFAAPVAR